LNSYKSAMLGLADYLGDGYELVLHSLEDLKHSVIYIINGHYTGRKEGAPITDLALSMLDEISKGQNDSITYFSKNKKSEPLKSATIAIRGENNRVIGLLCINFYMNTSFCDIIGSFMPKNVQNINYIMKENFAENSDELIESIVEKVKNQVYMDQSISTANKNKAIISMLGNYGIFNIKDSVVKIADLLNISKNTVYMHLRNKNGGKEEENG
jgi:predicted transcriptional regulator YheO